MRFLTVPLLSFPLLAMAAQYDLPGNVLNQGEHFLRANTELVQWHNTGDEIANADSPDAADRVSSRVRDDGEQMYLRITYALGMTPKWTLGAQLGQGQRQTDTEINTAGGGFSGRNESSGMEDIAFFSRVALGEGGAFTTRVDLPTAAATPAKTEWNTQAGQSGALGRGYAVLHLGLEANWVTELQTQYTGSLGLKLADSRQVDGLTYTEGNSLSLAFGRVFALEQNARFVLTTGYEHIFAHQEEGHKIGDGMSVYVSGEYKQQIYQQWFIMPYLNLSMTQPGIETFDLSGKARQVEYMGGTETQLGVSVVSQF
jgi:hypothetical protein